MLANNETGAIQPVAEVARIAHEAGAIVHYRRDPGGGAHARSISARSASMC